MNEESLFIAALDKPPAARRAFLAEACGGDAGLRDRVERLLVGHSKSGGILEHPAAPPDLADTFNAADTADRSPPPAALAGTVLAGRYTLLEAIGEGGMGSVWLAEQTQPVRRKVAVKLLKAGMDSKTVLARFEAERQALALMDHPHIAKVLDGGTTDAGRPFFVMEYVQGVPLTAYCDAARLSVADRLALFVPICQAVQHAHQKGIVHRDLKPSNILVCLTDGKPVPKVIDFGLAKAMHEPLTEHTLHTAHGQMLGTPLYMAPEQAEFNNLDVDTRADVYALGVTLYELLTGTTPLEWDRLRTASWDEMLRLIREEEPPRPSARLSGSGSLPGVAARRRLEPARLTKLVRGELDWIVMKCLEKDRSRRYDTANGLARDVQRYLADEPVEACPPSTAYRLRKAVRKYRLPLVTVGAFVSLLVAAVATLTAALVEVDRERRAKETALDAKETALQAEGKRRKQARAALDAMSSQVIEDWLASQPVLTPQHKQFLRQALRQYEEFAADTGQDEESRAGVAEAFERVGEIRDRLGLRADAEAAWKTSQDLYAALATDLPNARKHRHSLAHTHLLLGRLYRDTGRNAEAEATIRQAVDDFSRLVAVSPFYRHGLARCLDILGVVLQNRGKPQDAEAAYGQALAVWKELIAESPSATQFRHQLAVSQLNLGNLLNDRGRVDDALALFEEAVALLDPLAVAPPAEAAARDTLVRTLNSLGGAFRAKMRLAEAEAALRRAATINDKLVTEFPAVTIHRRVQAMLLNSLADVVGGQKRTEEGEELFRRSMGLYKQLAADLPTPDHQCEAATVMDNVARQLMCRNAHIDAARLLVTCSPKPGPRGMRVSDP